MDFQTNSLYKLFKSSSSVGLLVLDRDNNIVQINSAFTALSDYLEYQVIGKSINTIVTTYDKHDSFSNIVINRVKLHEPLEFKHEIKKADGSYFWANIHGEIHAKYSLWVLMKEQQINKQEKAIKEIIASMYKKDNIPFMDAMTLQLSKTLNSDHTFIGAIQDNKFSVKTLSHCMDKKIVDGFEYNLKNTPCELVYDGKASVFPQDVASLFPQDQDLKDLNIQGYAGIPLFNGKNETLGIIVALYREPIQNPEFVQSTISLFANIVANEYERQKAEQALNEQAVYYQSILDGIKEPLMVIDKEYNIILMNKAASDHKVLKNIRDRQNPKCYEVSHKQSEPCDGIQHPCPLKNVLETKEETVITHDHPDENGVSHFVELTATPLYDKNDNFIGIIESSKDITEQLQTRKQLEEYKDKLHYEEHYNSLTKLPNRILFYDRIEQAIRLTKKTEHFAILFIDIDNFKAINDSLGVDKGNEVLTSVAHSLKEYISYHDSVAHFGADEFGLLLQQITTPDIVVDYIDQLINLFKEPIILNKHKIYITISIGVSLYPDDNIRSNELVKFADIALHKAKTNGKNTYEFYTKDLTEAANKRIILENSLRESIANSELLAYYQPKIDASTNSIVGMEALVRWNQSTLGLVVPVLFIPLAEEIKFISNIDLWMLDTVSKTISQWYKQGLNPGTISINLSIQTLKLNDLTNTIARILQRNECSPEYLELEITESQLMDDPYSAIEILNKIKRLGIKISVDDFGTGYSSLAYLKRLPIDTLKIDKTFIDDLPHNEEDVAISKTIISLAQSLKLTLVAEGVENVDQKNFLLENGCNVIQGYLYYKPQTMSEIQKLLEET
jgi:diguanylate cyclase (GGDEF)-like protein/PAS domain S-box-containing protein